MVRKETVTRMEETNEKEEQWPLMHRRREKDEALCICLYDPMGQYSACDTMFKIGIQRSPSVHMRDDMGD
jgi:hypothetical protein